MTKSEERLPSLVQATTEAEGFQAGLRVFWFTSEKRFTPDWLASIFEPIWATPDRLERPKTILSQ